MSDYFLKLQSKASFDQLKTRYPFELGEGGVIGSPGWSVDVLGHTFKAVAWDGEGEPTYEPVEGYLINLRSDEPLPENLVKYQVFPETPKRVWA